MVFINRKSHSAHLADFQLISGNCLLQCQMLPGKHQADIFSYHYRPK
jgi:hypothetical protein